MTLHRDPKLFQQAIQFTSDQLQIPAIYVEKDYWVTYALHTIFHSEIGKETVFKGGTALSKCYDLIERFSEDIDLVVLKSAEESSNKLKSKIKAIGKVVSAVLPEVQIDGLTQKVGMNRKTAHTYTKAFQGKYGQIRDAIVLEATWLGYFEPYTTQNICSFVGKMILENRQTELATEFDLLPFPVQVLEPSRTICEKIMSLVRFSYGIDPITDLRNKIRHIYDLNQLLLQPELKAFFASKDFEIMLLKVAQDDMISFKNNNLWLKNHPGNSILFENPEPVWKELKSTYNTDFANLVYGDLPDQTDLLQTLQMIKERIKVCGWTIDLKAEGDL